MRQLLSISLLFVLCGCASFERYGVTIDEAETIRYFSIGSHNKVTGGRTDVRLDVPIEGVPVGVEAGGTGFLTSKRIHLGKIGTIEYYELGSRNENLDDIQGVIESIPGEFYEYRQFEKGE